MKCPSTLRLAVAVLLLSAILLTPATSSASPPTVQAMVVFATNQPTPRVADDVGPFASDLSRVFGYNSFEVIGQQARPLPDPSEYWLLPCREFYLKLFGRPGGSALRAYAELYQKNKLLLGLDVELASGKPLFIRGPQWGKGQIIIVLQVKP